MASLMGTELECVQRVTSLRWRVFTGAVDKRVKLSLRQNKNGNECEKRISLGR